MPYTIPTVTQFKIRHNAFTPVCDELVEAVIDEASGYVDQSWLERDFQPALMFLTAHFLMMEGHLSGGPTAASGPITSEKLGDASVSYGSFTAEGKSVSDFTATSYGRRYLELLRVNQPAVAVV